MQRPASILVLAVCAALLAGCAAEPVAEVTPTPAFASEAEAFAAAEATYRAYVDALNKVDLADPETFEAVYAWTTGEANAGIRESLSQMHANGWRVDGQSIPVVVEPLISDPGVIELAVCLDVSGVAVVDREGSSVVAANRGDVQTMAVVVSASTEVPTGWVIAEIDGRSTGPQC